MERKARSDRLRKTPSPNPQRINSRCWYYESRGHIEVVSWDSGRCSTSRIPWRMLMESARRCGKTATVKE
jgi:hypothetical protein